MDVRGAKIDIFHLLCVREADVPVTRRGHRCLPAMSMAGYLLLMLRHLLCKVTQVVIIVIVDVFVEA